MTDYMQEALRLAEEGRGLTSPNPSVGAVVVKEGIGECIIGRGFHTWGGVDHAEVIAIREAGATAQGATLYVTLEPCSHRGRTEPCVDTIIRSGISRVVAALQDPNPQVNGEGFAKLRAAGIEVILDEDHRAAAERINDAFIHFMRTGRPLVTMK